MPARSTRVASLTAAAVMLCYLALGIYYNVSNPLWEAPDEPAHFEHVIYVLDNRELPVRQVKQGDQLHQPPLYYVLGAVAISNLDLSEILPIKPNPNFIWRADQPGDEPAMAIHTLDELAPYRGSVLAVHLLRFLSLVFCSVAVLCSYLLTRLVVPGLPWLAVAAVALCAFIPQFLFVSATMSNDSPAIAFGALTVYYSVKIALQARNGRQPGRLDFLMLGLAVGLGTLSKLTYFGVAPIVAPAFIYTVLKTRGAWWQRLSGWLLSGMLAAVTGGWWYLRNLIVYGNTFDVVGKGRFDARTTLEIQEKPEQMAQILSWYPEPLFQSFWLRFGWMNISPDKWFYDGAIALSLLAGVGLALFFVLQLQRRNVAGSVFSAGVWLAAGAVFFAFALTTWRFAYTIGNHFPQGRYLFPTLPAIALLAVLGLYTLLRLPAVLRRNYLSGAVDGDGRATSLLLTAVIVITLGFVSAAAPRLYIEPNYSTAPLWLRFDPSTAPNPVDVRYAGQVSLIGHQLQAPSAVAGEQMEIDLYWYANSELMVELQAFVHILDDKGQPVAQKDGPAGDDYPITSWRQGETIRETRVITLPETMPAGKYRIGVGLYSLQSMQRLPITRGGDGDVAILGEVTVLAAARK